MFKEQIQLLFFNFFMRTYFSLTRVMSLLMMHQPIVSSHVCTYVYIFLIYLYLNFKKTAFCISYRKPYCIMIMNVQQSDNKTKLRCFHKTGLILHSMLCSASTACQTDKEKLSMQCLFSVWHNWCFQKISVITMSLSVCICNLDATRPCVFFIFHPSVYSCEWI